MKKKKIIAMLLCTAMVGGMVAGCGSTGSSDEGSKSAKGDAKGKVYYLNYLQEQNEGFRSEITEVKSYIYHNYEKELNVEILAEKVYLSAGYLSAIFKEATGMNLNRFIREVRMNKAKELLENSTKKITQIAREVGFSNTSYFCRSFREFFGSTPELCRKGEMDDKETEAEV